MKVCSEGFSAYLSRWYGIKLQCFGDCLSWGANFDLMSDTNWPYTRVTQNNCFIITLSTQKFILYLFSLFFCVDFL